LKLENEIHQKKFRNEYHKLGLNIIYTSNWITYEDQKIFRQFGLTLPQYNALRILRGSYPKPVMINYLVDRLLDKTSNASRIVDKLCRKELVNRSICEGDRRSVDVLITKKALRLLEKIDPVLDESYNRFKNLALDEAKELNELLDKLRG
jgi:DNA-binding MarR family transcriptional regulator